MLNFISHLESAKLLYMLHYFNISTGKIKMIATKPIKCLVGQSKVLCVAGGNVNW